MGKKDTIPNKQPCGACNAQGGHWEVQNGGSFKKRVWRDCTVCKGKKYV